MISHPGIYALSPVQLLCQDHPCHLMSESHPSHRQLDVALLLYIIGQSTGTADDKDDL